MIRSLTFLLQTSIVTTLSAVPFPPPPPPPSPSPPPPTLFPNSPPLSPYSSPPMPCYGKVAPNFLKCQYACVKYLTPLTYYTELFIEDAMRKCAQTSQCIGIEQSGCSAFGHYHLCSSISQSPGCGILKENSPNITSYLLTRSSLIIGCISCFILMVNYIMTRHKTLNK